MSSTMTDNNNNQTALDITLKWNKQTYDFALTERTVAALQQRVQDLTYVPVARQKLLSKTKAWKGPLKPDFDLQQATIVDKALVITLIGSAETLTGPTQTTTFVEDLTPAEVRATEEARAQAAWATAHGMISALQVPPHYRDDGKQEWYMYNRLVTGLPQRQIERELQIQQAEDNDDAPACHPGRLQGTVALQLGLELRRAYVNDLKVLNDGTCVSVLDDGHVQGWKHAQQAFDVIHPPTGNNNGPVTSIVTLNDQLFATAGRGTVQLWTNTADQIPEPIVTLSTAMPGTCPNSLTRLEINDNNSDNVLCLAARLQITHEFNPHQFHLPPQNEAQRQRRAQAQAQEQALQQALQRAARSLQVWVSDTTNTTTTSTNGSPRLQSRLLEPPNGVEGSAPVTCLTSMRDGNDRLLIAGDAAGGLRIWKAQSNVNHGVDFVHQALYQLDPSTSSGGSSSCSIVCLQALPDCRLAVSTESMGDTTYLVDAQPVHVDTARAVHIFKFASMSPPMLQSTLTGHSQDAVICMCALPNGDLLTGGGKLNATTQLWSSRQLQPRLLLAEQAESSENEHASRVLVNLGYVFAMAVLPDAKEDSHFYAVAAARYNTIKVIV